MKAHDVAQRFFEGRVGSGSNIMSTGDRLYSYEMLIARKTRSGIEAISTEQSPSKTTSKHINVVLRECKSATIVQNFD